MQVRRVANNVHGETTGLEQSCGRTGDLDGARTQVSPVPRATLQVTLLSMHVDAEPYRLCWSSSLLISMRHLLLRHAKHRHEGNVAYTHNQRRERSASPALTTKDKRKNAAPLSRSSGQQAPAVPALEGFMELLGSCFPAVAPAVCLAVNSVTTVERMNARTMSRSWPLCKRISAFARNRSRRQ